MLQQYQSNELDWFVVSEVIEGHLDEGDTMLPKVSQNFGSSNLVFSYILLNYGDVGVSLGERYFNEAVKYKFMFNKNPISVYKVSCLDKVAYGRSFSEAICKLAICLKFNLKIGV